MPNPDSWSEKSNEKSHFSQAFVKESTQNWSQFLQVSESTGTKPEETKLGTKRTARQAAVGLTNTFSHSNPAASEPLSTLKVCRASGTRKKGIKNS